MKKAFGTIREQTVNTERQAVYNTKHRLTTHGSTRVLGAELKDSFFYTCRYVELRCCVFNTALVCVDSRRQQ